MVEYGNGLGMEKQLGATNPMIKRETKGLLKSRRGAAAVEFAIMVPVIAALVAGLADFGMAMFDKMELTSAARAGAQMALLDSSSSSVIKQVVVDSTDIGITTSDVTTTLACECADGTSVTCGATCSDSSSNQYYYSVNVSYDHTLLITGTTITLTGSATVRTQ